MAHTMTQKVNYFAVSAFRDTADKDYIHARQAYRAGLFSQFYWSALHSLEKYAKCIMILTRTSKGKEGIKHEVNKSLELISCKIKIPLTSHTKAFIDTLENNGARFRYFESSWHVLGGELAEFDRAVWELRRYCNPALYNYSDKEFVSIRADRINSIINHEQRTKENTYIQNGFLEKTIEDKESWARPYLVWGNFFYPNHFRNKVKMRPVMHAENSPFFLFPEIIDEVSKFVFVPKEVRDGYSNLKN